MHFSFSFLLLFSCSASAASSSSSTVSDSTLVPRYRPEWGALNNGQTTWPTMENAIEPRLLVRACGRTFVSQFNLQSSIKSRVGEGGVGQRVRGAQIKIGTGWCRRENRWMGR